MVAEVYSFDFWLAQLPDEIFTGASIQLDTKPGMWFEPMASYPLDAPDWVPHGGAWWSEDNATICIARLRG